MVAERKPLACFWRTPHFAESESWGIAPAEVLLLENLIWLSDFKML